MLLAAVLAKDKNRGVKGLLFPSPAHLSILFSPKRFSLGLKTKLAMLHL